MTQEDFAFLRALLRRRSGLALGPEKLYLAESRLQPVARAAGLAGLSELVARLRGRDDGALATQVVDAMATHETMFFRDRHPFETLGRVLLPALARARPRGRPLRLWSAATSTGQEAYSLAMLVHELRPAFDGPVEILATDMSAAAIAQARAGLYSQFEVQRGLPVRHLLAHFDQVDRGWQVRPSLRALVTFRTHNLVEDPVPPGGFDVILCRNLLIYLDQPGRAALLGRLSAALAPGGVLGLGATEATLGLSDALTAHPAAAGFLQNAAPSRAVTPLPAFLAAARVRAGARVLRD